MTQVPSPAKPHAMRTTASVQGCKQSYRPSSTAPCCPLWALSCTGAGGCWSLPQGRVMGQPPQSLGQQPAPLQVPCLPQPPWGDVHWANGVLEEGPPWIPPLGGASQLPLAGNPKPPPFPPFICQWTDWSSFWKSVGPEIPIAEWKAEESHKFNNLGAWWGHSCNRREEKKKSNKRCSNKENPFSIYQALFPQPLWMPHLLHSPQI